MQSFKRAYRDPQSPLTPLTPMSCNTAFNFNFGGDNSLKEPIANATLMMPAKNHIQSCPTRKRYSEKFLKIRSVFSPGNVKPFNNRNDFKMKDNEGVEKSIADIANNTDNEICQMLEKAIDCLASIDLNVSTDTPITGIQLEESEKGRKVSLVPQDQLSQDEIITPLREEHFSKVFFSRPKKPILNRDEKISASIEGSSQISPFTPVAVQKIISNVNIENSLPSTFSSFTIENDSEQPKTSLNAKSLLMSNEQENISTVYEWNWLEDHAYCANNPVRRKIGFRKCSPVSLKPLSPRVEALLRRTGLCKYNKLFQEEEIDMEVLKDLTTIELKQLGILSSSERTQISRECMKLRKKNL